VANERFTALASLRMAKEKENEVRKKQSRALEQQTKIEE